MFLWLYCSTCASDFLSSRSATVLLTSHMRTNVIVIAVSTCVCYGVALKFTPDIWVVIIES